MIEQFYNWLYLCVCSSIEYITLFSTIVAFLVVLLLVYLHELVVEIGLQFTL